MNCPKCGSEYDDSYKFCPKCGEKGPAEDEQSEQIEQPTSVMSPEPSLPTPPQPRPVAATPAGKPKGGFKKFWSGLPAFGKVLLILGVIIILVIIGVAAGTGSKKEKGSDSTTTSEVSEESAAPEASTISETKPPVKETSPPPPPKAAPTWQTVIDVSGNANKRTQVFHLGSGQQRLLYNMVGDEFSICSIYVIEEGDSLEASGGFPEVLVDQPGSSETALVKSPGNYYLDVQAANCSWQVTIQEMK